MDINTLVKLTNQRLAGETLLYNQLEAYFDDVVDKINSELNASFPTFSEHRERNQTDNGIPPYTYFPDKYIRSVVSLGAAVNFYTVDEEGINTAQQMQMEYLENLFIMKRDYSEQVPEEYKATGRGYLTGGSFYPEMNCKQCMSINGGGCTRICGALDLFPDIRYLPVQGPPGPEGKQGLIGPQGEQGPIGPIGPQGVPGYTNAQSASYIICAEDSVNKEGATAIVKQANPFNATDVEGNPIYDENGNAVITNNLQVAFDEIFNRDDFKYGSEIIVRRGTYINTGMSRLYHLYIRRPCKVRFEDTRYTKLGSIHLEANGAIGTGWIHLIGAYCDEIDVNSFHNIVENCHLGNAIVVSSKLNTVINNFTNNIYLTGDGAEVYAKQCRFWGNTRLDRSIKSDYIQADGFVDTEGDIYTVNDIECTAYIRSLSPVKSISANGTPLEPDADKNVDIPLATTKTEWGPVYDEEWGEEIYTQKEVAGDAGLMSGEEKLKLKQIEEKAQINKIEKIKLGDVETVIKDKTVAIPYTSKKMWEVFAPEAEDPYDYLGGLMTGEQHKKLEYIENGAQANKIESVSANGKTISIKDKKVMLPINVNPEGSYEGITHNEDETGIIPLQQSVNIVNNWIQYFIDGEVNEYGYIGITLNLDTFINDKNVNGHTEEEELHMANAEFIFKTPANTITFSYPSKLKFIGLDVEDGVFVPQPNMKYDIIFSWCKEAGIAPVAYVSGYEVS